MRCHRCQGLLVGHTFYDLNLKAEAHYTTTRCINCGHIEDAVVQATPAGKVGMSDPKYTTIRPKHSASAQ